MPPAPKDLNRRLRAAFPALARAPEEVLAAMAARGQHLRVPPGTVMQAEGDTCTTMGFQLDGRKRVYKQGHNGREITLYEVGPGEICILNAASLLSRNPCPATAAALTEVETLAVPAEDFRRLVVENEAMRAYVFGVINHGFTSVLELVTEVAFGRMDQRLTEYLIEKSEDGCLEITHQAIANDLGTAREVVSRLLKDLERRGKVRLGRARVELVELS
jgi:CRP/FNR family transcriptional regulator